jgi:nucleotide-binding universal stress UspA family protein
MFHRLLVAFDGSAHAQRALAEAIDLARAAGAELAVLTVAPEPSDPALGYVAPANLDELSEQIKRSYQNMLDAAVGAVPADLPVTGVLRRGSAGPAIVDEATAGEHAWSSWVHVGVGSFAHFCSEASAITFFN